MKEGELPPCTRPFSAETAGSDEACEDFTGNQKEESPKSSSKSSKQKLS
jgi:hypothetical protein